MTTKMLQTELMSCKNSEILQLIITDNSKKQFYFTEVSDQVENQ